MISHTVIFDLFGVVFSKGLASSLRHLTAVFNRSEEQVADAYRRWERKFDLGDLDERQFWALVNADLGTNIDARILSRIVLTSYQVSKHAISLARFLSRSGCAVVVYSNFRREWFESLDSRFRVTQHFSRVFISSDTKVLKPDARAFEIVREFTGVNKSNLLLVDDEVENVNAVEAWGGIGVRYDNPYETEVRIRQLLNLSDDAYVPGGYSGVVLMTVDNALILQRRDRRRGIANPGKLSVFGGSLRKNETFLDCAKRELREECGLDYPYTLFEHLCTTSYPTSGEDWMRCNYFLVRGVNVNDIDLREGSGIEVRWPEEAIRLPDLTVLPRVVIRKFVIPYLAAGPPGVSA